MSVVAFSIGKAKRSDQSVNKTALSNPGPGQYKQGMADRMIYASTPAFALGQAARSDMANSQLKFVPGPGQYKTQSTIGEGPKYHIGIKGATMFEGSDGPGPGAYKTQFKDYSASYSMKGKYYIGTQMAVNADGGHEKLTAGSDFNNPGPGSYTYNQNIGFAQTSIKFGQEKRKSMAITRISPAPNAYNIDFQNSVIFRSPAYGFGSSKQRTETSLEARSVPGPGTYTFKTIIGTETQGKSIAGKFVEIKTTNMQAPGPGTYEHKASTSIGCKIGTSTREDKAQKQFINFPAADAYNPSTQYVHTRPASFSFGTAERNSKSQGSLFTPAPNAYKVQNKSHSSQFSIGLKLDNQSAIGQHQRQTMGNPGPGAHNPNYNIVKNSQGAFTLKSRKIEKPKERSPGPGAYETTPLKTSGIVFSKSPQREPLPAAEVPGPGNYKIPCEITRMPNYTGARSKDFAYI